MTTVTLHGSYLAALMQVAAQYGCLDQPFHTACVTDDAFLSEGIESTLRLNGALVHTTFAECAYENIKFTDPTGHVAYLRAYLQEDGDIEAVFAITYAR